MVMKKYVLQARIKWFILLLISTLILMWRLIDFVNEVVIEEFQMTRGGFELRGPLVEIIELVIILGSIALMWKAITKLVVSHLTSHFK